MKAKTHPRFVLPSGGRSIPRNLPAGPAARGLNFLSAKNGLTVLDRGDE